MKNDLAEFGQRDLIVQTILWQVVGFVLLACHVELVKFSVAFYPVVLILIGLIYARAPLGGLLIFMPTLLFQNIIISIFSNDLDYATFNLLQGTNFFVLVICSTIAGLRLLNIRHEHREITLSVAIGMAMIVVYTLYGTLQAGPNSAVTYFREYAGPILAGLIGIEVGRVWGFRTIGLCILYSSVLALLLNLVEYLDPIDYYTAVNEVNFFRLKLTGDTSGFAATSVYTPDDIVTFSTTVLFNITGASPQDFAPLVTYRFLGTIVNPISNGYVMAVLGILAVSLKRGYWLWLIIPMLVLVGVKGANILLFSSLILYGIWLFTKNLKIVLIASICWTILYIAMGIIIGLSHNDFHVLGFLGGVKSIVHNPLGHGIGVGGNGSAEAHKGFKWTGTGGFANNGVDFALESSIGVLIYQMGVFSVIVMTVFGVFLWRAPWGSDQSHTNPTSRDIIFLSLGMIIVNGIFQEEAFAPYACGLIMLLVGVLTGNRYRGSRTLLANPV